MIDISVVVPSLYFIMSQTWVTAVFLISFVSGLIFLLFKR